MTDRKSLFSILSIALCSIVFLSAIDASAERFNIVRQAQRKDQWCWAASSSMILEHYGFTVTQEKIVTDAFGSLKNQGGTDTEILPALNNNGVASKRVNNAIPEATLKQYDTEARTFMFAWLWSSGGGHALVFDGIAGGQYYVIDPWQSTATKAYAYAGLKNAGNRGNWSYSYVPNKGKGNTGIDPTTQKSIGPTYLTCQNLKNGSVAFAINPTANLKDNSITIYNGRGAEIASINVENGQSNYLWNNNESIGSGVYYAILKGYTADNRQITSTTKFTTH